MIGIPEQIDQIISKRKARVHELETLRERTQIAYESVLEFTRMQREFRKQFDESPSSDLDAPGGRITSIATDDFLRCYAEYEKKLGTLIQRLNRDSLHISFVGRAGQGKSLLMQRISGLSGNVIPSADGPDCTGAKSIITNTNQEDVSATIDFFTENEMIDIINRYLDKITHGKRAIHSVREIRSLSIPKLTDEDVEEKPLAEQLQKYIDHYDEYIHELGTKITIPESEIEKYVAQNHQGNPAVPYYKYLGVKLANISCSFPYKDTGKIVLVDTIGIGAATSHGTEEDMLNTVEYDSDAILFLFRPDGHRSSITDKEIRAIKKIKDTVTSDYCKEMLFWIVNRVETGVVQNAHSIPMVVDDIKRKDFPIAEVIDIDCSNHLEVEDRLLKPVLERLSQRITTVDQRLIDNINVLGTELYEKYRAICQQTDSVFEKAASEDMKDEFGELIEETYEIQILGKLRDLYYEKYNVLRHQPCIELVKEGENKLRNITLCVPPEATIIEYLKRGSKNQVNAYEKCTDFMRLHIIDDFTGLNIILDNLVEQLKQEVIHILVDNDCGRLCNICPFTENTAKEWFHDFIEKTNAEKQYPLLAQALKEFSDYTINVQGFIIPAVRNELDPIDISLSGVPYIYSSVIEREAVAREIRERLLTKAFEVHDKIEFALKELYSSPNKSMFAALKDLYDRLTYASEGTGRTTSALAQWESLYKNWLPLIWKEEYQAKSSMHLIAKQWNDSVDKLKNQNDISFFNVLGEGNL